MFINILNGCKVPLETISGAFYSKRVIKRDFFGI